MSLANFAAILGEKCRCNKDSINIGAIDKSSGDNRRLPI